MATPAVVAVPDGLTVAETAVALAEINDRLRDF